jgi:hypothetical protein
MQSKSINAFIIAWFLLTLSTALAKGGVTSPVQILSMRPNGLTLEFRADNWRADTLTVNGDDFVLLHFDGSTVSADAGAPQIPYHVAVIGIPIGATAQYQILETEYDLLETTKILPYPSLKNGEDDQVVRDYTANPEIYGSQGTLPVEPATVDPPGFFRDQQIVRLRVAGARFLPGQNQVWKYKRIVVQVEFVGGQTSPVLQGAARGRQQSEENLYRSAVVNYEQAANWRRQNVRAPRLDRTQSIFEFGTLYRFNIQQEGIYKIDGAFLESQSIVLSTIVPAKIRLFNNGGRELPRALNQTRPDGLVENRILVVDGGDGRFDRADYILFYGIGVEGWNQVQGQTFSHYVHNYATANVYWLSFDGQVDGLRMSQAASGQPGATVQETYLGMTFLEEELSNPIRSSPHFFGRQFAVNDIDRRRTFTLNLPNAVAGGAAQLKLRFVAANEGRHQFAITLNDSLQPRQFNGRPPSIRPYLVMQRSDFSLTYANSLLTGSNNLLLSYSYLTPGGQASTNGQVYFDWYELIYDANLRAIENELPFTVSAQSAAQSYRIAGFTGGNVELYDVTDFTNVQRISGFNFTGGNLTFTDAQPSGLPKRFLALDTSKYKTISSVASAQVADLRNPLLGAEFVIITHEDFYSEAQRLESLRENGNPENRLETEVVRISDVYANFSGGLMDAVAIRDFIKYAYENWSIRPGYVLLVGDGDFDPRNIINRNDKNWIPTYQTDELATGSILEQLVSRTTDSWYTYIVGNDTFMDLAIGRLPVQTLTDARSVVDKIIAYETQPERGGWRNTVTMVGDDELVNNGEPGFGDAEHIRQAETIAQLDIPDFFDIEKIYLSEFPKVIGISQGGVRKPAAKERLIQQINKGTLIVNYIGHGNPTIWAHEEVFHLTDNPRVQNPKHLPFFIAATCDWALYDDPDRQSQPEELLLVENRGAIGILTAARLVFSGDNYLFNRAYYAAMFAGVAATNRVGDAFVVARMNTPNRPGQLENDEKYHIIGDPTMRLGMPTYETVITSMTPDSIVALSTVTVTGEVHRDGQLWSDFNGRTLLNTFDSKRSVQHFTELGAVQNYLLPGNSIYRGVATVENGRFSAQFIVPKDISYGGNLARVSAYSWNDDADAVGYRDNILVSSSTGTLVDREGPQIKIYFSGNEDFVSGDMINEDAALVVELADTVSGINITGETGHRLTLTIDPDEETCLSQLNRFLGISNIDLTDLFQFSEGSHLSGRVEFPLQFPQSVQIAGQEVPCTEIGSDERRHTLVLKAWDNSNNSSTISFEVLVVPSERLVLKDVLNYPNPFPQTTTFTFIANHDAEVTIKIYTVAGRLIRTLDSRFARSGFNMIEWDGRDGVGDPPANGVYLYKLIARSLSEPEASQTEIVGKLAIVR